MENLLNGKLTEFEDLMLFGVAAVVSKIAAAPIERVKLLLQCQDEMIKQGTLDRPYAGVIDCVKRTWASEGTLSFWRGSLVHVIMLPISVFFKDQIKALFAVSKDASPATEFATNIASGGLAGCLSLAFVYSLDFARTKLANDVKGKDGTRQYNGLIDVYRTTLASDGIKGLYRGFVISCVDNFIYHGLCFGLDNTLKPLLLGADAGFLPSFLLERTVTMVSTLAGQSIPIDTISRRMMMTSGTGVHYKSSIDCGMQILENEGFMSLMKGASADILFCATAGAGVFAGFVSFRLAYILYRFVVDTRYVVIRLGSKRLYYFCET